MKRVEQCSLLPCSLPPVVPRFHQFFVFGVQELEEKCSSGWRVGLSVGMICGAVSVNVILVETLCIGSQRSVNILKTS